MVWWPSVIWFSDLWFQGRMSILAAPWRPVTFSTVSDLVVHPWYLCMHINIFFKHNHFFLLCHCIVGPLKCFISLINKKFSCFWFLCQYFQLPITETPRHSTFFSVIICGLSWGSFAVQFGDHLRSRDHLRSQDHLRRCTGPNELSTEATDRGDTQIY